MTRVHTKAYSGFIRPLAFAVMLVLGLAGESFAALSPSDYSNPGNWMSVPQNADKSIDVFFLYPSAWYGSGGGTYADINDELMRAQAREFLAQTTGMFDHVANVYAPYYRQTNAADTLGLSIEDVEALTRDGPGVDALAAFKYYLENYNQGRPFILVSHSQGSSTMKVSVLELLAQDSTLLSRMIAAYTVGWTFTAADLASKGLKFAQGPDDTGVIIAWNTESPGVTATNPVVYLPGALVINPINWTTTDEYADASESLGSTIPGYEGSDGRVDPDRGVVINTTLDPDYYMGGPFTSGMLHGGEWELYFYDVFQNVITRSVAYYTPQYTAYTAALNNGRLGNFTGYLRALLARNPNPGSVFFHPVHTIFFRLAGQPGDAAFKAEAEKIYSSLTPQASGQALVSLANIDRGASGILGKQLRFAPAEGQVPLASADSTAVSHSGWNLWAQPLYHKGTQRGDSLHTKIDAEFTGISIGAVNRQGNWAYGLGFYAGKADFDGDSRYNAEAEGLGAGIGVTRRFRFNDALAPELSLTGGYSRYSFEQRRRVTPDVSPDAAGVYESEPSATLWNAGLVLGDTFTVTEGFALRPEIGFDYVSMKMERYRESGGALALEVRPERHESFRSSAGLVLHWRPVERLRLFASGHWHHEFADDAVLLRSSLRTLDSVGFAAHGRDLGRDSGTAGLGLEWSLPAPLDMRIGLDYAHSFSRTYTSNAINASLMISF